VDVAATGRELGTATVLAMLQILDQALGRMRTSGHAAVLAEMAVVRLATIEDLESLAAAVDRVAAAGPAAQAAPAVSPRAAPAPAPQREKKTADLTPEPPVASAPAAPLPPLPADPLAVWRRVTEPLEGLVADFAATATAAAWRDDLLEVTLPAEAATAASFLRRPDSVATIAAGLESQVGRALRYTILLAPPRPAGQESERPPQPAVASQAALMRAATDHPLVAHARGLFDAAIRKVEPLRPREVEPAGVAVASPAGPKAAPGDEAGPTDGEPEDDHG